MANLVDVITDHYPPVSGLSIPLGTAIFIQFDRLMNEASLADSIFLEGPDTDQYVGPGLLELNYPQNVSQGAMDDFLRSPGYAGIAEGTFTITGLSTPTPHTEVTFVPKLPMAPSTTYKVHIVETQDADCNTVSGHVTWSFETGTGSIQELPNNISTSVLAQAFRAPGMARAANNPLSIVDSNPKNHSVENSQYLPEIDIVFDKAIDPNSVLPQNISVVAYPSSDHPNLDVSHQGDVMFDVTVSGNHLKLKI